MGRCLGGRTSTQPEFAPAIASPSGCPAASRRRSCFFACSRMGYVCNTSLHRDYTCKEIVALLERAGSAAFFAQPGYGADAGQARHLFHARCLAAAEEGVSARTVAGGHCRGERDPIGFGSNVVPTAAAALPVSTNPDRIVYLAFTSGTTGQPKGVMHSDNTMLANGRAIAAGLGIRSRYDRLFVQSAQP